MHRLEMPDWVVARGRMMNHFREIDPARTALLVVDMQNAFIVPGEPLANPTSGEIVPTINRLIAAARAAGMPLFWSRHTMVDDGPGAMPDWQRQDDAMSALSRDCLTAGASGHAVYGGLDIGDEDTVFDKYRYSCFYNAAIDVDAALRARGIDCVIVTGTVTNCCCQTTAQDAVMRGYKTIVISDGTAALTDLEHQSALICLRIAFADVRTADEVVALLAGERID